MVHGTAVLFVHLQQRREFVPQYQFYVPITNKIKKDNTNNKNTNINVSITLIIRVILYIGLICIVGH